MAARKTPRNMLHLMFDPSGLRPSIANWEDVAKSLFQRVYRESVGRVIDERIKELIAALLAYPDVKTEWKIPIAPIALRLCQRRKSAELFFDGNNRWNPANHRRAGIAHRVHVSGGRSNRSRSCDDDRRRSGIGYESKRGGYSAASDFSFSGRPRRSQTSSKASAR
jgi:hypothetical protein